MGGACSTDRGEEKRLEVIGRKAEGRRPLGRPRRRWVDNIRTDLGEVGWGDVDWISLAQDRDSSCECGNEPLCSINAGKLLSGFVS
jgi:hypothetical protein